MLYRSRNIDITATTRRAVKSGAETYLCAYASIRITSYLIRDTTLTGAAEAAPETAAARLAGRAHALIRTQFHTPLSTVRLAHKLHSNPDYLGRIFRRHYGCTLTEALHQRRLKHARKLLLGSDHTVDAIALESGFSDVGYFRRVFKRSEGLTPYAFRKLYSKVHINTE